MPSAAVLEPPKGKGWRRTSAAESSDINSCPADVRGRILTYKSKRCGRERAGAGVRVLYSEDGTCEVVAGLRRRAFGCSPANRKLQLAWVWLGLGGALGRYSEHGITTENRGG